MHDIVSLKYRRLNLCNVNNLCFSMRREYLGIMLPDLNVLLTDSQVRAYAAKTASSHAADSPTIILSLYE
jgi:hypothetical protein